MKNAIRETEPGVFAVELTQGQVALIDAVDLELVSAHRWCADRRRRTFYAKAHVPRPDGGHTTLLMHRLILPGAEEVDHVNGSGLDNRRANLRAATRVENNRNVRKRLNSVAGHKGVSWHKHNRLWRARITVSGREICLGYFDDREAAA
jgi:hypothetical protein